MIACSRFVAATGDGVRQFRAAVAAFEKARWPNLSRIRDCSYRRLYCRTEVVILSLFEALKWEVSTSFRVQYPRGVVSSYFC